MRHLIIFLLLFLVFRVDLAAQPWSAGAKTHALAGSGMFLEDAWAARNQPAALGTLDHFRAGVWAERRFGLKELTIGAFSLVLPVKGGKGGSLGLGSYIDGGTVYLKTYVHSLSYGLRLTPALFAGAGMHLVQFKSVESYGNSVRFSQDLGIIYKSSKTAFGIRIWNLVPPKVSAETPEKLPSVYTAGIRHELNKAVWLSGELHHELNTGTGVKTALRYRPSKTLALYAGFNSLPLSYTFGASLFHKNLSLDLSFGIYNRLGNTPGISIEYGREEEK